MDALARSGHCYNDAEGESASSRLGRPFRAAATGHTGAPGAACVPPRAHAPPCPRRAGSTTRRLRAGALPHLRRRDARPLRSAVRRLQATASALIFAHRAIRRRPVAAPSYPARCSVQSCALQPMSARRSCCVRRPLAPRRCDPARLLSGRCVAERLWCVSHASIHGHHRQAAQPRQGQRRTGAGLRSAAGPVQ